MKKFVLILIAISIALSIAAAALDLSTYPEPFVTGGSFQGQIIVGGDKAPATDVLAATEISVSLQQQSSNRFTASTEDEFAKLTNSIMIGLPCQNSAVAYALDTNLCDIGLPEGTGYIKLVSKEGKIYLVVTGKTSVDIRKAARALAKYKDYSLAGTEALITGTLNNPVVLKPEQPIQMPLKEKTQTELSGCKVDADCAEDEWCMAGKCAKLGCPEGTEEQNHDCIKQKQAAPKVQEANESKNAETKIAAEPEKQAIEPSKSNPGFFGRIISFFKSLFNID